MEALPAIPDARFRWLTVGILLFSMVASQTTDKGTFPHSFQTFKKGTIMKGQCLAD